jgi:hypothetical protein
VSPGVWLWLDGGRGYTHAFLRGLLDGATVQSILEILLVNVKAGVSKKTNQPYSISEAHCVLRNDDGTAGAVGVLQVPKGLEEAAKPGIYSAAFALEAPTYGENQGKIVASLKGLTALPPNAFRNVKPTPSGA